MSRFIYLGTALVLALLLTGCSGRHRDEEKGTAPAEGAGGPIIPNPAGGGAGGAGGAVRRGAQRLVNQNLMEQLGLAYVNCKNEKGAPKTLDEFHAYLASSPDYKVLVDALDKGWLVMILDPPPSSNQVLAYEKEEYQA